MRHRKSVPCWGIHGSLLADFLSTNWHFHTNKLHLNRYQQRSHISKQLVSTKLLPCCSPLHYVHLSSPWLYLCLSYDPVYKWALTMLMIFVCSNWACLKRWEDLHRNSIYQGEFKIWIKYVTAKWMAERTSRNTKRVLGDMYSGRCKNLQREGRIALTKG